MRLQEAWNSNVLLEQRSLLFGSFTKKYQNFQGNFNPSFYIQKIVAFTQICKTFNIVFVQKNIQHLF